MLIIIIIVVVLILIIFVAFFMMKGKNEDAAAAGSHGAGFNNPLYATGAMGPVVMDGTPMQNPTYDDIEAAGDGGYMDGESGYMDVPQEGGASSGYLDVGGEDDDDDF